MSNQDYLDTDESGRMSFDFRGYLFKVLNLWKFVLLCVGCAMLIAYFINVRKQNVYKLDSLISVDNDQNPFFTANTSISFNWGGVSGQVGKILTTVKTRSHNEKVVDSLQYYMEYLVEGKYRKEDIYKNAPFEFIIDKTKDQVIGYPVGVRLINANEFEIFTEFETSSASAQKYSDQSISRIKVPEGIFTKTYKNGDTIALPFLNGKIVFKPTHSFKSGSEFFLKFSNFDAVVNSYKSLITIGPFSQSSSSILKLQLSGHNKAKIVDYLNATSSILSRTELQAKNLYATNTIKFIDSSLTAVNTDLKDVTDEMNQFRKKNKIFDVSNEISQIAEQLRQFDLAKQEEVSKLDYLNNLEVYLNTKTDYTQIAAPTSAGIEEGNILNSVSKIVELAAERQNLEYTTKEGSGLFKEIDRRIDSEKNVLLETIDATKKTLGIKLATVNRNIANLESKLSGLPEDEQQFLKIQRKLDISQEAYNIYTAKRSEAAIVKAANISDITIIDEAKDIGGGLIGPNKSLNYMMALMMGFFIPMFLIFVTYILDNTIHGSDEIERMSKIPILGLIGKYRYKNNLVAYEKPKSAVAESFRAIRSTLQFIFKNTPSETRANTLMITSSVSGEGKTFTSINIATVYALSGKKTILLGLDLRKPKIFDDFSITNDKGVVNYLIGD